MGDMAQGRSEQWGVPGRKVLEVKVTFGASTAITSWSGQGITNVAKNASGVIDITLARACIDCKGILGQSLEAAAGTAALHARVTSDLSTTTGVVQLTLAPTATGTATDPTSGHIYTFWLVLDELGLV